VSFPFWIWACIFATSGLLALALEIVWFRVLAVTMKGTAFTFGTLLGVYLTGSSHLPRLTDGLHAGVSTTATCRVNTDLFPKDEFDLSPR
jgi:hypothetical protein